MDKEQSIISNFANNLNGDDGAIIGDMVYSKDMFVEGIHFKSHWLSPKQIGKKAMIVNLSDAIAMNATPKYALLGLGLPKNLSNKYIKELSSGLKECAAQYGTQIIGGDTILSNKLIISLTIISYLNSKKPLIRNGAKIGDIVCYTGVLGGSIKGLRTLLNGGKISSNSRFVTPNLRQEFIKQSAKWIRSGMDISDGLASDLPKITQDRAVKFNKKLSKFEFISGEEYEMLIVVPPKNIKRVLNQAKKCRVKLNLLGKIINERAKFHGKFTHF
ncbi:thiamine monophosphate kinase [Campylobacter vicugnae]|uniref:Thiamine-monophosphate kinase n=1 Tax=Campylobacter vicugnae TaxID=1660076 RepID=A0A1X9T0N2_9BACT|nr:thiamine-phosphate kinase [Campylobacter sp. RM8964]ARR02013.1 thiamine monophosphate kinase [Campylobacter sp. RM8964]